MHTPATLENKRSEASNDPSRGISDFTREPWAKLKTRPRRSEEHFVPMQSLFPDLR